MEQYESSGRSLSICTGKGGDAIYYAQKRGGGKTIQKQLFSFSLYKKRFLIMVDIQVDLPFYMLL